MSGTQRLWFALVFVFGLAFIAALPPLESNDEEGHWIRQLTVAEGQINCGQVRAGATVLLGAWNIKEKYFSAAFFKKHWNLTDFGEMVPAKSSACIYPPVPYLPAVLGMRLFGLDRHGEPQRGGFWRVFYLARVGNWIFVSLILAWAIRKLPWASNTLLVFYSIPEVIQQSFALGTDPMLFACALTILVLIFRAPRAWWAPIALNLLVAIMASVKPLYLLLGLVGLPLVVERRDLWKTAPAKALLALFSFALPFVIWKAWESSIHTDLTGLWMPSWNVKPADQIALLRAEPSRLLSLAKAQWADTFRADLIRGSWLSIFCALGHSIVKMSMVGYDLLVGAVIVAWLGDYFSPHSSEKLASGWATRVAWLIAALGIIAIIPAVVVGMYIYFSSVGVTGVKGVQGRYYLIPILMMALLKMHALKFRSFAKAQTWAAPLCMIACLTADGYALKALVHHFWGNA